MDIGDKYIYLHTLRSHDRKGRGYVPKEVFLKVLSTYADGSPDVDSVAEGLCGENGWVPYPKFLALFEHAPPPDRPPTETTSCKEPGNVTPSTVKYHNLRFMFVCTGQLITRYIRQLSSIKDT